MPNFCDQLEGADLQRIKEMRRIIKTADKSVSERDGAIMSAQDALVYEEDGVMKYGLAKTKTGFTFHSMVMYANTDIAEQSKSLSGVKPQKGCLNIKDLAAVDMTAFEEILRQSAAKDFSPVIAHYKNKR